MMNSDKTPPNIPDYEDLAFEPALTWGCFCKWIRKNYRNLIKLETSFLIRINHVDFYKNGTVKGDVHEIAKNRTYEQMKTIIDALEGDE